MGASIAVNGVCLTAAEIGARRLLRRCLAGNAPPQQPGRPAHRLAVNLERPLSPSGRLGGHLVQGHVDATGEFAGARTGGRRQLVADRRASRRRWSATWSRRARSRSTASASPWRRSKHGLLAVAIIPHTYESTALKTRRPGDRVNLECDVLAKYVEKLLGAAARIETVGRKAARNGLLTFPYSPRPQISAATRAALFDIRLSRS